MSGMTKKLMYEYRIRIEPLKCDRDVLKQECRLAALNRRPISVRISREQGPIAATVSSTISTKRKLWGHRDT